MVIKDLSDSATKQSFSFFHSQSNNAVREIGIELSKRPDWTYAECKEFVEVKCREEVSPYSTLSVLQWAVARLGEEIKKMQLVPSSSKLVK